MIGTSLSRWSMAYFAAALLALLAAEAAMAWGYGYPRDALKAPATLVVVHLTALGWLSLLMFGALFQFVPVLVNRPLAYPQLALPALACILLGLLGLVAGFLELDGVIETAVPSLAMAGPTLILGLALAAWIVAATLARAWPLPLPAAFVAAALVGLAAAGVLGLLFTQVLGGVVTGETATELASRSVPVHAAAGLGGWLAMCALGVSYRLVPMFLLSPDPNRRRIQIVFLMACVATAIAVAGGFVAAFAGRPVTEVMAVAVLVAGAAVVFYGRDIVRLYRARRRMELELNTRIAVLAFASLGLAVIIVGPVAAFAGTEIAMTSSVYLLTFGWLTGLGLAQLYKIVPFMTWLECYGPVLGRSPTPRVQDLVAERRAQPWFVLYFVSVWAGTMALVLGSEPGFSAAAGGTLVATAAVALEVVRARLLSDVAPGRRFPAGTRRPRLFVSLATGGNRSEHADDRIRGS